MRNVSVKLLTQILEEMKSMRSDINDVKGELNGVRGELDDVKSGLIEIRGEIGEVKETQEIMQTQISETNRVVQAIREAQEVTSAKLDNLSMDVHILHGEIASLKQQT